MSKNPRGKILRGEPKEQHLSIVPKSCPIYIYIYICRAWVWAVFLRDKWIQAQQAQYNKFVESG